MRAARAQRATRRRGAAQPRGRRPRLAAARASRVFARAAGGDTPTAGARFPSSKLKLDELFLNWLSLPESQKLARAPVAGLRAPRSQVFARL